MLGLWGLVHRCSGLCPSPKTLLWGQLSSCWSCPGVPPPKGVPISGRKRMEGENPALGMDAVVHQRFWVGGDGALNDISWLSGGH